MPGPTVIPLSSYLIIFKYIALIFGVIVIAGASFSFDIWEFIGIRQTVSGDQRKEKEPVIKKHGLYGIVR
ncbi:MAG: hypothetical protein ACXAC2_25000, partial [Candidatus Kariarchaeaceae archaeon]